MIYGIGIDLIEIHRIKGELEKFGDRFCGSIFTEDEVEYCKKGSNIDVQAQCFAGRFSAKEAFFKSIGTGLRNKFSWKDVEIMNDELGKPSFRLRNKAREFIEAIGVSNIQLSISHSRENAVAVVILEK
jgi:holo-[acyl-carrier protein] synthase